MSTIKALTPLFYRTEENNIDHINN